MAKMILPPGFRFHPTDVELILYYLKRKVMGRRLHSEAIGEVNIYKFFPWELPDKSCLKSKDLEWYFFCPREKKYASGVRVKRATKDGYWKTTGRDRSVCFNKKTVGTVKTLVFHIGHAPRGERTNWVIHEYRILDDHLAAAGVQDNFVLCKIFEKAGPGPKNGAQYGAPFNEEDWADDDVDNVQKHSIPLASDDPSPTAPMQWEKQICPHVTGLFTPGSVSRLPVTEGGPFLSAVHSSSDVLQDETNDEIDRLLDQFTDDDTLLLNENAVIQEPIQKVITIPLASNSPSQTALMQLENQTTGLFTTGGASGLPVTEGPLLSAVHSTSEVLLDETDEELAYLLGQFTDDDMLLLNENSVNQQEKQTCPLITGLLTPGSASGLAVTEEGPLISAGHSTNEVLMDETDDVFAHLLGQFTDDNMLLSSENAINQVNNQFDSRSNAAYDEFFALGQPGYGAGHVRRYGNSS